MSDDNQTPLVIYQHGDHPVEVRLDTGQETIWLRQEQMSELFGRERSVVTKHLRNIFREGELDEGAVCANFAHTAEDGKTYQVCHYNLDVVISVGYRVKSHEATHFRRWATRVLREHLTQGWTLSRQRFEENARELEAAMALVRKTAGSPTLDTTSGRGLIDIVTRYAQTFLLLQRYDEGLLTEPRAQAGGQLPTLAEARTALASLKSDPANKETMIRLIMNMLATPEGG
ncbi:virulence RhuM family protein [Halomonas sp. ML-15]|uniref:virulence RhuM family protein n=1 Tax=Halomonas sp. ML-15 TaxID=2773305 RepID=UPI00174620DC|nr:RhuM family protein [Halomonas sp. ML-15]MBD3896087.1 virulence RhuM family protein [Halomonas sp. ML-15]